MQPGPVCILDRAVLEKGQPAHHLVEHGVVLLVPESGEQLQEGLQLHRVRAQERPLIRHQRHPLLRTEQPCRTLPARSDDDDDSCQHKQPEQIIVRIASPIDRRLPFLQRVRPR